MPSGTRAQVRGSSSLLLQGVAYGVAWGSSGDTPVPGDYDGDGKTDITVWRPGNGTWYILRSCDGGTTTTQWGTSGDEPLLY